MSLQEIIRQDGVWDFYLNRVSLRDKSDFDEGVRLKLISLRDAIHYWIDSGELEIEVKVQMMIERELRYMGDGLVVAAGNHDIKLHYANIPATLPKTTEAYLELVKLTKKIMLDQIGIPSYMLGVDEIKMGREWTGRSDFIITVYRTKPSRWNRFKSFIKNLFTWKRSGTSSATE